jgi:hypothetical protein
MPIPDRLIDSPQRYLGGDAYNYIVEASIKGGEIAAAKTTNAIYLVGGTIIFFGSLFAYSFMKNN